MIDLYYKSSKPPETEMTLSALVGEDSVFYCMVDDAQILYESNHLKTDHFFEDFLPGRLKSQKIKACSLSNKFLISNNTAHLQAEDFKVFVDKFTDKTIYCKHVGSAILPQNTIHLATALDHLYYLGKPTVFHVHFELKRLHIYYKEDGHFQFYNNYEIDTAEDVLYFIELVHNVVISNKDHRMPLEVSGLVERKSIYMDLVARYYPEINFVSTGLNANGESLNHLYFGHYLNLACV